MRGASATFWSDLGLGVAGHLQPKAMFFAHRHVRVERVGLEHHRQARAWRREIGDVRAVDLDMPR
jgi:hypothetical protein